MAYYTNISIIASLFVAFAVALPQNYGGEINRHPTMKPGDNARKPIPKGCRIGKVV